MMRATAARLLILTIAIVLTSQSVGAQRVWRKERVSPPSSTPGAYPTLAIDGGHTVHVSYSSLTGMQLQWYASNAGGAFDAPRSIGTFQWGSSYALALDSAERLHFVTSIGTPISCLQHVSGLPDQFGSLTPVTPAGCTGHQSRPALAADLFDALHMVYEMNRDIYYQRRDPAGVWSPAVNISRSRDADDQPSLAVTPEGTAHITYITQIETAPVQYLIQYVRVSGSSFSRPETIAAPNDSYNKTAPIVIDGRGGCHVIYSDVMGDSLPSSILYTSNAGGPWSTPTAIATARSLPSRFYSVSLATDRYDRLHVAAGLYEVEEGAEPDWDLVYLTNIGGRWSQPEKITRPGSFDYAYGSGKRFIDVRDSLLAITYFTNEWGRTSDIVVLTTTIPFPPRISVRLDTLDLGEVRVRKCTDSTIRIYNRTPNSEDSLRVLLPQHPPIDSIPFSVVGAADSARVGSDDSITISIRFCPRAIGAVSAKLLFRSNGGVDTLVVMGRGAEPERRDHRIWIDTIPLNVGERGWLTCRIDPPLMPDELITSFRIEADIDSSALFPYRAVTDTTVNGTSWATLTYRAGEMIIEGGTCDDSPLTGATLVRLEVLGLLTGQPFNRVAVRDARLTGSPTSLASEDGAVLLAGCDIDRGLVFGRRTLIRSIHPSPAVDRVNLIYQAPRGSAPELRLFDLVGGLRETIQLPEGTGEEEEIHIPITLTPGLYAVELSDGATRSLIYMVVSK